jgi:hypothetical protein
MIRDNHSYTLFSFASSTTENTSLITAEKMKVIIGAVALLLVVLSTTGARADWILGQAGDNCIEACYRKGMICNNSMPIGNDTSVFHYVNAQCTSYDNASWSYGGPAIDPDSGRCWGYMNVPAGVACQEGTGQTFRRVCHCDHPNENIRVFSTGWSQGWLGTPNQETPVFSATLANPRHVGVMTHFWLTPCGPDIMIKYYIDGETEASIQFTPSLAAGVGFDDHADPWGNEYFGKGAFTGAWFWNFKVPFYKSVKVTISSPVATGIYIILRGGVNIPINVGSLKLNTDSTGLRLVQYRTDAVFKAQEFITLANVSRSKSGVFFMHTLSFAAPNLNTLEACYHWYSPYDTPFPGTLLSTGTEDFFDSAYYFNGGQFHLPVSGFTHLNTTANTPYGSVTFSAYRFHNEDPLQFKDGLRFVWRNGDQSDASGEKCNIEWGGSPNGSPGTAHVKAYAWVYECDNWAGCI